MKKKNKVCYNTLVKQLESIDIQICQLKEQIKELKELAPQFCVRGCARGLCKEVPRINVGVVQGLCKEVVRSRPWPATAQP